MKSNFAKTKKQLMKRLLFILILAFVGVTNASAAYSEMAVRDTSDIDLRGGNFPWGGG